MTESKIKKFASNPKLPIAKHILLTFEERAIFRLAMAKAGMCYNTLYQRMAYIGFKEWEAKGVARCIKEFCYYEGELTDFYKWLEGTGDKLNFIRYMEAMGLSRRTTMRRFAEFDFKPWELEGIENILRRCE